MFLNRCLLNRIRLATQLFKIDRYCYSSFVFQCSVMEKTHILYGDEASPPVRFVLMTASMLNIELVFHKVDLFRGEHLSDFYKKINPLKKVPSLAVGTEVICDSHAIALYLCERSDNQDFYPKDTLKKARVDEMLFFNSSALFPVDSSIFTSYFAGKWPANEKDVQQWYALLDHLEYLLNKNTWLADDKMLLCDLCCAATVSSLQLLIPILERHVKVNQWMKKIQAFPCFKINARGLERLSSFVDKMKS